MSAGTANTADHNATAVLVLETGLFNDKDTLAAALQLLQPLPEWHCINPESMNDSDWDNLLNRILSVQRVVTL